MNEKCQAVKVSRSLQMTLSVIAERQLIVQFSIEKQYSRRTYQIEASFSEENWLIFVEFREKDAWEDAGFPATAQVNSGNQPLATVATEKSRFGKIVAILAIGLFRLKFLENIKRYLCQYSCHNKQGKDSLSQWGQSSIHHFPESHRLLKCLYRTSLESRLLSLF